MSRFEKVSLKQWVEDCGISGGNQDELRTLYENIKLPAQATAASAGCDFYMPFDLNFEPGSKCRIATGIRWVTDVTNSDSSDAGKVLLLMPRSGLGFKYGIRLSNTIGVIDADYCGSDNEGHIIVSLENPSDETVQLPAGKPFCQGIVVSYDIPEGAESGQSRNGGFGSTDR